ncbi:gluconokinase [Streptomyces sp. NPDC056580]|uniref:gluconokinase n=1 Tax=Streptomyces sp. NPDC056580 TaxID=3345872 RepID=UPI003675F1DB
MVSTGRPPPRVVVVTGVGGVGKTTVGRLLAAELDADFCDGDWLHPPHNVEKMRAGHPLDDGDRAPWLRALAAHIEGTLERGGRQVVCCSALKKAYRDVLAVSPHVFFAHLTADPDLIRARLADRSGHFFPASLTDSQFADLEPLAPGERGATLHAAPPPERIVADLLRLLRGPATAV